MKVILTGSTGFIGHEVLLQCLNHPSITSIIALSRRDLPAEITSAKNASAKLKVVVVEDWLTYSDEVVDELRGAEGWIWWVDLFSKGGFFAFGGGFLEGGVGVWVLGLCEGLLSGLSIFISPQSLLFFSNMKNRRKHRKTSEYPPFISLPLKTTN